MKPRPLKLFGLPGLKSALSLKLRKFVKIGSKNFAAIDSPRGEGGNFF